MKYSSYVSYIGPSLECRRTFYTLSTQPRRNFPLSFCTSMKELNTLFFHHHEEIFHTLFALQWIKNLIHYFKEHVTLQGRNFLHFFYTPTKELPTLYILTKNFPHSFNTTTENSLYCVYMLERKFTWWHHYPSFGVPGTSIRPKMQNKI